MKRSLSQVNKLFVVGLLIALLSPCITGLAQQPAKPTPKSAVAPVHHKKKHRKHKKHTAKHQEIKHSSDNDKELENIKAEKNKGK